MSSSLALKNSQKSRYELSKSEGRELFIITSTSPLNVSSHHIEKIVKYSASDNNIVRIYELTSKKCASEFYPDLTPMVIIQQNNFYESELFLKKSKEYANFINDIDRVSHLYDRIVDSYIDFIKNTGCYFEDMSANNILVDSDYDAFKIIDIFSVKRVSNKKPIKFDPVTIMMSHRFRNHETLSTYASSLGGDKIMSKYFDGIDLEKTRNSILSRINTRTYPSTSIDENASQSHTPRIVDNIIEG